MIPRSRDRADNNQVDSALITAYIPLQLLTESGTFSTLLHWFIHDGHRDSAPLFVPNDTRGIGLTLNAQYHGSLPQHL